MDKTSQKTNAIDLQQELIEAIHSTLEISELYLYLYLYFYMSLYLYFYMSLSLYLYIKEDKGD